MSARAPQAISRLWDDVHRAVPRAQLGGVVGDVAHSFGYHLARNDLPGGDYSVQLAADRRGAGDAASALDITLPPDLMTQLTGRLLRAARAGDPRLRALREFCGTLNGSDTYPWDLASNSCEGVNSWDSSHLWHIHLSFYRQFADDYNALAPIADVLAGHDSTPAPPPTPPEEPMARVISVSPKDCARNKIQPLGAFLDTFTGELRHIGSAEFHFRVDVQKLPYDQFVSVAQYRAAGGR